MMLGRILHPVQFLITPKLLSENTVYVQLHIYSEVINVPAARTQNSMIAVKYRLLGILHLKFQMVPHMQVPKKDGN